MSGRDGFIRFLEWQIQHEHDWSTFYCPLTSLRRATYEDTGREPQFMLPYEFKRAAHALAMEFPLRNAAPQLPDELILFDTRCWWLGISPMQGLQLRRVNLLRSNALWP
jgi:hypothetical protein